MSYALVIVLKATILLSIAGLATILLARSSASIRHLVWLVALASLVALPVAVWFTPAWTPEATLQLTAAPIARTVIDVVAEPDWRWPTARQAFGGIYLLGVAVFLVRLLHAHHAAARIAAAAQPFPFLIDSPVRLSGRIAVPLVCGLRHPVIVLPDAAASWPESRLRVVLAHESMHIRRGDLRAQAVAHLACVLYWFHPLVWWAASRLRLECEQACDDGVLAQGERASAYAGHLVEIVRGITAEPRAKQHIHGEQGAIAMARTTDLEHRLKALFQLNRSRRSAGPGLLAVASLAAAVVLVPLAALRAPAQTAGSTLAGTVRDASGAAVPKAAVTITIQGSDRKEFTTTNEVGEFSFSPIPDGRYKVSVAKPGFALAAMEGVVVAADKPQRLAITLAIGKVQESLDIVGERPPSARASSNTSPASPQRIKVGGSVMGLKMVKQVRPAYPVECKAEGVEGTVLLRTVISKEGVPLNVEPVNQLVDKRLVDAAKEAVVQWRYQPTLLNGEPVEVITEVQVNFTLAK